MKFVSAFAILLFLAGGISSAADFAPVTTEERSLTAVPGQPNAPAVVLFKRGTFSILDPNTGRFNPTFSVKARWKILTEEGKRFAELTLHHSRQAKLQELHARTVLANGREVPVPEDSLFRRRTSRQEKRFETSIAFPAVEVGAILDYSYKLRLKSAFLVEPWYFQDSVPTLFSEIVYELPRELIVQSWPHDPMRVGIQQNSTPTLNGGRILAWGKDLPPIPDEPYAVPFTDLASHFMLIPITVRMPGGPKDLFKTWNSVCEQYADGYEKGLRKGRNAERKAQEILKSLPPEAGKREQAQALYRFVRDEIESDDSSGIGLAEDATADSVLSTRSGGSAEKALLLRSLLAAAGISSRPVWAAERSDGMADPKLSYPWWFDREIVAAEIDGRRVFLDPSDRSLGFGRLDPDLEGMPALLYDPKNPEIVQLPLTPFSQNLRQVKIELSVDDAGRLSGRGTLHLTGHHAWRRLQWQEDAAKTTEAWKEWLQESYREFTVADIQVKEEVEERRVEVSWSLAQREEEVLGDEATLSPSLPLGPVRQPFQSPASTRVSPVLFPFGDRDEVELTLRWPQGWKPESLPTERKHESEVGAATLAVQVDEAGRTLTYRRRLDIKYREYGKAVYEVLQTLYGETEKNDAQTIVLVRE